MALLTNVSAEMLLLLPEFCGWALMQPAFDMQAVSLQLLLNKWQRPLEPWVLVQRSVYVACGCQRLDMCVAVASV
jgi:hypothetical protein